MKETIEARSEELFAALMDRTHRDTDRLFVRLLAFQWVAGVVLALAVSPRTWAGAESAVHVHVWAAVFLGGLVSLVPCLTALRHPGSVLSRQTIAIGQSMTSALLIHLCAGRIETHFHVFGSLAFLAFYRDWRVLATASAVVAADHMVRGIFWPQSVFGVLVSSNWRWAEHAAWVVFEDFFLLRSCLGNRAEKRELARRQAELEWWNQRTEAEVQERTQDLREANRRLRLEGEERSALESERDVLNHKLAQAQKLEAVGQLAAGIAHEINTPTQYVGDNARFLEEAMAKLLPFFGKAETLARTVGEGGDAAVLAGEILAGFEREDLAYLAEEIPSAIKQSLEGVGRVTSIVRAMKEFSHPGVESKTPVDLNRNIESTITVARNEWKYVATVETDLDPHLPPVPCVPGELNQVFLNVLVNAAHAIADVVANERGAMGRITVATRQVGDMVEVSIADTGAGIPEEIRGRVFDPFFTTKEVGRGTGQGLSIAHGVVVNRHGGSIELESEVGRGTTFRILLPLSLSAEEEEAAAA